MTMTEKDLTMLAEGDVARVVQELKDTAMQDGLWQQQRRHPWLVVPMEPVRFATPMEIASDK